MAGFPGLFPGPNMLLCALLHSLFSLNILPVREKVGSCPTWALRVLSPRTCDKFSWVFPPMHHNFWQIVLHCLHFLRIISLVNFFLLASAFLEFILMTLNLSNIYLPNTKLPLRPPPNPGSLLGPQMRFCEASGYRISGFVVTRTLEAWRCRQRRGTVVALSSWRNVDKRDLTT